MCSLEGPRCAPWQYSKLILYSLSCLMNCPKLPKCLLCELKTQALQPPLWCVQGKPSPGMSAGSTFLFLQSVAFGTSNVSGEESAHTRTSLEVLPRILECSLNSCTWPTSSYYGLASDYICDSNSPPTFSYSLRASEELFSLVVPLEPLLGSLGQKLFDDPGGYRESFW